MNNLLDADIENEKFVVGDNEEWVKRKDTLDRLANKKFFKELIDEGYFKDYVFELVMMLVDDRVVKEGKRSQVIEKLVGVAKFKDYMDDVKALAYTEEAYAQDFNEKVQKYNAKMVSLGEALDKANRDKDFKAFVNESYFTDLAVRQTSLLASPQIIEQGYRPVVIETLAGISTLANYLIDVDKKRHNLIMEQRLESDDDSELAE